MTNRLRPLIFGLILDIERKLRAWAQKALWRPVPGFKGYEASTLGRIRSYWNGRWGFKEDPHLLGIFVNRNGYQSVNLRLNKQTAHRTVHRVILETFIGPKPEGLETRHLNGVKTDNRLANLAYGTHKENMADQRVHGTLPLGDRKPLAKLSYIKAKAVRTLYASGGFAYSDLSEIFGVDSRTIRKIIAGEYWREEDAQERFAI